MLRALSSPLSWPTGGIEGGRRGCRRRRWLWPPACARGRAGSA